MKIRCVTVTSEVLLASRRRPLGVTPTTVYNEVVVGQEYTVIAMALADGVLYYLLGISGYVFACPAGLFEVVDPNLPYSCSFKLVPVGDPNYPFPEALWGYRELVNDTIHYRSLLEQEQDARLIFFQRMIEEENRDEFI